MPKPATLPRWATDLTNNDAPSAGQMNTGWTPGQMGVSDYDNYIKYWTYKWVEWLNNGIVAGGSNQLVQILTTGELSSSNTLLAAFIANALTAAANGHVTVSGTGDYKHGEKTISQSCEAQYTTSAYSAGDHATGGVKFTLTSAGEVRIPIKGLKAGDRLIALKVRAFSANEPSFAVTVQNNNTISNKAYTTTNTITGSGVKTLTLNTPYTLVGPGSSTSISQGDLVFLNVGTGGSLVDMITIDVYYDRP